MTGLITEDQIERSVERQTDSADRAFMAGNLTQEQYDKLIKEIAQWAERQYAFVVKQA